MNECRRDFNLSRVKFHPINEPIGQKRNSRDEQEKRHQ